MYSYRHRGAEADCLIILQQLGSEAEVVVQWLVAKVVLELGLEVVLVPEVDLHAEPPELLLAEQPLQKGLIFL